MNIILLIGIPGSGKSFFAKSYSQEKGIRIVSTDWVRAHYEGIEEKEVWPMVYKELGKSIERKEDVIFDATSATPKVRERLINNIKELTGFIHHQDYEIKTFFFPTGAVSCVKRVAKRNKMQGELYIPLDVIPSYGKTIIPPTYDEGFSECRVISNVPELIKEYGDDSFHGYALYYKDPNNFDEVLEEYSGFSDITDFTPVKDTACFRLASVSKQFIAYGICKLVHDGLLSLDDKLFDIFTGMPEYTKNITVKNLLNHTSGIHDYDEEMEHGEEQVHDEDVLEWVKKNTSDTYFEIGSKYQYSNTAYILLGLIIKEKSKMSIGEYMDKNVFKPLEMFDTKVNYEPITEFNHRSYGTNYVNGKLVKQDQYWCSATIGDGGIYSNIIDLKKWVKHIQELENMEYPFNLMVKPNIIGDTNTEYGFGLRIKEFNGHKIIYHNGFTIGTHTSLGFIKDLDVEFIFLINEGSTSADIFIENIIKKYSK